MIFGNKKAQSAMEYLMTYGWAILIVIIVAAALYALGVFNPAAYTGRVPTGFQVLGVPSDWDLAETDGIFRLRLANNKMPSQVIIKSVTTTLRGGNTYSFNTTNCTGIQNLTAGEYDYMTIGPGGERDIDTYCTGTTYTIVFSGVASGTSYSASVKILYNSGGLDHTDTGTVTGVVS